VRGGVGRQGELCNCRLGARGEGNIPCLPASPKGVRLPAHASFSFTLMVMWHMGFLMG